MAIMGGTGSGRQVLAEILHFLFCRNSSFFAAFLPRNKKAFLKFKTQRGGRKRHRRRARSHLTKRRHVDDEGDAQIIHDGNQKAKQALLVCRYSCYC